MTASKEEPYFVIDILDEKTGEKTDEWHFNKAQFEQMKRLKKTMKIHRWQTFLAWLIKAALDAAEAQTQARP